MSVNEVLDNLIVRYPQLEVCKDSIFRAYKILEESFENNGKLMIGGNGGSASDSEHIVGELMKSFSIKRAVSAEFLEKLKTFSSEKGEDIYAHLQGTLPCISLVSHYALATAYCNDIPDGYYYEFAQKIYGFGNANDVFLAITTSGNSKNCVNGAIVAKAKGIKVIALTGSKVGKIDEFADVSIKVPEVETYKIQELHLPIYHCLCMMLEERFF